MVHLPSSFLPGFFPRKTNFNFNFLCVREIPVWRGCFLLLLYCLLWVWLFWVFVVVVCFLPHKGPDSDCQDTVFIRGNLTLPLAYSRQWEVSGPSYRVNLSHIQLPGTWWELVYSIWTPAGGKDCIISHLDLLTPLVEVHQSPGLPASSSFSLLSWLSVLASQ